MPKTKATFIEPMLLLRMENRPQGADWLYEIKLDGYRALAIKSGGKVQLRSRNDNDFTERYSSIAGALGTVPDETVLDGELAALDEEGRPSFNLLQNYVSSKAALVFFIFDVLILSGRNGRPSSSSAAGVEGLVAKPRNSRYEPGQRSGVWRKMRINRGQKFVIGGYSPRGDPDLAPGHTCAAQPDRDSPRLRASLHVGSSESRLQHQPGAEREPRHWDIPCEAQKHGGR